MTEVTNLNALLLAELHEVEEVQASFMEGTAKGGGFEMVPEGVALAVITGYIEFGKHEITKGKSKGKLRNSGQLVLELFDIPGESDEEQYTRRFQDDDGKDVVRGSVVFHNIPTVSISPKARFLPEYEAMFRASGLFDENKAVSQQGGVQKLLGKVIMVSVKHNKYNEKTYANLELDKCTAPYGKTMSGKDDLNKPLSVPVNMADIPFQCFLWNAPTPAQWASIEREGTHEVDRDGKKEEVSNNWIQEKIKAAANFMGSPLESLLLKAGDSSLPTPKKIGNATQAAKPAEPATSTPAEAPTEPAKEEVKETASEAVTEEDTAKANNIRILEESIKMMQDNGMDTAALEKQLEAARAS